MSPNYSVSVDNIDLLSSKKDLEVTRELPNLSKQCFEENVNKEGIYVHVK